MHCEKCKVLETSALIVVMSLKDETGTTIPFNSLIWSLTDVDGAVINSRDDVTFTLPGESKLEITGNDLFLSIDPTISRVVSLNGTYISSKGDTLNATEEVFFDVIPAVSP